MWIYAHSIVENCILCNPHFCGLRMRKFTFHFSNPYSFSAIGGHLQGSDSIILPFTTGGKHFHGEWFA